MLKQTISGILAGFLVGIGGTVYLSCDNRYVGALLFSVALLCICYKKLSLFTGEIGFLNITNPQKTDVLNLGLSLAGNILGAAFLGFLIKFTQPVLIQIAAKACSAKLGQTAFETLLRGVFCGILVFLAVSIYRKNKSINGIILGIPIFLLSGYEHCIANVFFFSLSGIFAQKALVHFVLVLIGNSLGAMIFSFLSRYIQPECEQILWIKK